MFSARHFVTGSVALFLIPLLQERGMSLTDAAAVLSLMALIGMPGRVGFAWLGDRYDKRLVSRLLLPLPVGWDHPLHRTRGHAWDHLLPRALLADVLGACCP